MRQGDVYWVDQPAPYGSEPGFSRPFVIVQGDALNESTIATVVACAVTSNLRLSRFRANVALDEGEAGLDRPSVVNVTQVITLDRSRLGEKLGTLSSERLARVLAGLAQVLNLEPDTRR